MVALTGGRYVVVPVSQFVGSLVIPHFQVEEMYALWELDPPKRPILRPSAILPYMTVVSTDIEALASFLTISF
jgi:hypothetical protein